ncbi:phosphopantetheine adenylyltransferase [bacterium]|nr:MAG: phosphopantetheine adenylyltransferase [bacterium]|tara:strand:+ start:123 stop:602 length:480 start_codon:yes stop_codon:yes gene_type:complete
MKRIVYPGTFDPIHNGHLDIARKAAELFDELILVVAVNQEKSPLFNDKERVELIKESLYDVKNVKVDTFNGLVVDFVRSTESVAIIRGLRHVSDFEFEFQMAMMNFNLNPNIKSLFMMPDEKYIHLNSTVIKDVARLGGDISDYVPKCVQDALYKQYNV